MRERLVYEFGRDKYGEESPDEMVFALKLAVAINDGEYVGEPMRKDEDGERCCNGLEE